jgi:hypothetical protein
MFRTLASRAAAAAAAALAVIAVPVASAATGPSADPVPVGHNQSFAGLVFGSSEESMIEVLCAGPVKTGHPAAGQSAEAILVAPPAPPSAGFTGTAASRIKVTLSWTLQTKTVVVPIGTLTSYYETLPVPTKITVPCGGTGTMIYTPAPGSKPAKAAKVSVTFQSPGT